jgi:uncharacterized protein YndB with AHSA1/START domain
MANQTKVTATPGGREVIIEREFDAPREKVWQAWTDPELMKKWLGPRKYEMSVEKYEFKPGGSYRYIHKGDDGEFAFHGVFHGIYPNEKAIQTFEFEGLPEPGHVSLDTLTLENLGNGKTKATTISVFQTPQDRDGMIQSGMEKGVTEGYERLDELLVSNLAE